ncbi:MAG TPA: hypothetical protein QKA08_00235 [Candidatus Megaira endosymbiont of Nemacystus decipiens]|nr:hypothetical protein [Candidatus Megaera endosymbiont of Nemacystus decipiens]
MSSKWLQALAQIIRELTQTVIAYLLGKERLKRQQTEDALELQETYEELDEKNKAYRDRGKSGLLERLRGALRNLSSSCPQHPVYTKAEWQQIEQAVTNLSPDSPLIPVMQDYLDLLDKLEVCND